MKSKDVIILALLLWWLWQQPKTNITANVAWTVDDNGNWVPVPLVAPPEPVNLPIPTIF